MATATSRCRSRYSHVVYGNDPHSGVIYLWGSGPWQADLSDSLHGLQSAYSSRYVCGGAVAECSGMIFEVGHRRRLNGLAALQA